MSDDPFETAWTSLEGYVSNGPAYWPCAESFTLASLEPDGQTDGGGATICRNCVREVAGAALDVMQDRARVKFDRIPLVGERYSAVIICGLATMYDITGNEDTMQAAYGEPDWCAQCGDRID